MISLRNISRLFCLSVCLVIFQKISWAQPSLSSPDTAVYAANTTATYRKTFYDAMIKWSVWNNLSQPLDADGEFNWISAFWPMELILYKSDTVEQYVNEAFHHINERTTDFQRALLELLYTNYPGIYDKEVNSLLHQTKDAKIFAMCAEYLWRDNKNETTAHNTLYLMREKMTADSINNNPMLMMLHRRLLNKKPEPLPPIAAILSKNFAPGQTVIYSFQRHDRDYPGMVIVRKPDGSFVLNADSTIFHVPQLARAISNLPSYLTNGNTPQGIFRMLGFDVSSSQFIGPTQNIQLQMPYEAPVDSFFVQPQTDTVWTKDKYASMLPASWKNYWPVYNAYYAGKAGRTAIIAHGTTINPDYYKTQIYYPETPSLGCLCASEIWSAVNGLRIKSDQQKLVDAVKSAGNGYGYCVVIELNDLHQPVHLKDVLPFIKQAFSNHGQ
jgi:hypothetical protein